MNAVDLTPKQIAALDGIVEFAMAHGMDIRDRSDLMLADIGRAVHVSALDSDLGLYALVNVHGNHNGVVIYKHDTHCSSYDGEDLCEKCEPTP